MKRFLKWASVCAFFLAVPLLVLAQVADPETVDTNAELFTMFGAILAAFKSGNGSLAAASVFAALITLIRNGDKIPITKALKIHLLVQKIPKAWFPVVVAALGSALGITLGLANGLPLLPALQAGLESALMSAGVHEVVKRPLRSLGVLADSKKA